jgi:hypothetical protein
MTSGPGHGVVGSADEPDPGASLGVRSGRGRGDDHALFFQGETRLVGLWESIVTDLECLGRGRPPTHTVRLYYLQLRHRWGRAYQRYQLAHPGYNEHVIDPGVNGASRRRRPALPADLARELVARWSEQASVEISEAFRRAAENRRTLVLSLSAPPSSAEAYDGSSSSEEDGGAGAEDEVSEEEEPAAGWI